MKVRFCLRKNKAGAKGLLLFLSQKFKPALPGFDKKSRSGNLYFALHMSKMRRVSAGNAISAWHERNVNQQQKAGRKYENSGK